MADTLTLRALNRATLARQLLLARERLPVIAALERIGGLQAQEPRPAYAQLWTRLEGFRRDDLHAALHARDAVRGTLMRATLHVMSAADYAALRPALQPMLDGAMEGILRQRGDIDVEQVVSAARELLQKRAYTFNELRAALAERFPDFDERAIGYAVRMRIPLLMVPTDGRWSFAADSAFTLAEPWLGRKRLGAGDREALVRRHLGAFGPASAADVQSWSGLGGLQEVIDGMAGELVAFRYGRRTLYDVPDAPRPEEDAAAPARLLPEFDSLLLAHKDRTRVIDEEHRKALTTKNLRIQATFLVDGRVAGSWAVARERGTATLTLSAFASLRKPVKDELAAEAEGMLAFLGEDAGKARVAFVQR